MGTGKRIRLRVRRRSCEKGGGVCRAAEMAAMEWDGDYRTEWDR